MIGRLKYTALVTLGLLLCGPAMAVVTDEVTDAKQAVFDSEQYGPVGVGEGLWNAARAVQTRYPESNIYQVIWALFERNPIAFQDDHIGKLRRGALLDVPSKRQVMRVDAEQARRNIREMMATLPRPESKLPPVESRVVVARADDDKKADEAATKARKAGATQQKKTASKKTGPAKTGTQVSEKKPLSAERGASDSTHAANVALSKAEGSGAATEEMAPTDKGNGISAAQANKPAAKKVEVVEEETGLVWQVKNHFGDRPLSLVLLGSLLLVSLGFLVIRRRNANDDDGWTTITEYVDPRTEPSAISERVLIEMGLRIDMAHAYYDLSRFKDVEPILEQVLVDGSQEQKVVAQELINKLPGKIS